jgi:hypothetical protein
MPPTMTTNAMPSAMNPISHACRAVSARLDNERKLWIDWLSQNPTIRSTRTGIAVSVQRFESISPSQWSGQ